jgi:hypothetical protein
MKLEEFKKTLKQKECPEELSSGLKALWEDAQGHWDLAHEIINEMPDETGSWIHAYLHRVEGDLGNARYWYHKANRPFCEASLKKEWDEIASFLLK